RRDGGGAPTLQGSSEGQPDAVARVDVEPDESARQARDAPGLVPHDRRHARGDRRRPPRGGASARHRPPRRGPPRPDHARTPRSPQPPARTASLILGGPDMAPQTPRLASRSSLPLDRVCARRPDLAPTPPLPPPPPARPIL